MGKNKVANFVGSLLRDDHVQAPAAEAPPAPDVQSLPAESLLGAEAPPAPAAEAPPAPAAEAPPAPAPATFTPTTRYDFFDPYQKIRFLTGEKTSAEKTPWLMKQVAAGLLKENLPG